MSGALLLIPISRFVRLADVTALAGVAALAGVTACGAIDSEGRDGLAGARVFPIDSVLLAEVDTMHIGYPFGLAIDPFDGSIYVTDSFSNRMYRFARDGSLMSAYGRSGHGPGEFNQQFQVAVLDDSTLAVPVMDPSALYLFDRATGDLRRSLPLPAVLLGRGQPRVHGRVLWLSAQPIGGGTSLLNWSADTDSMRQLGSIPEEYQQSRAGPGYFAVTRGGGAVAVADDVVLRGWGGLNGLEVLDHEGVRIERVELPAVRRRGMPDDGGATIDLGNTGPLKTYVQGIEFHSWLQDVARLSTGEFVITHHDLRAVEDRGMGSVFAADHYLSVLSADRRRACVDAPLPNAGDMRPTEVLFGDTLFVFDRRITADAQLESWVVLYGIDTTTCDWIETTTRP